MDTFSCCHCQTSHPKNSRHKNQKYCSSSLCQQARKNAWERRRLKTDADYKESRQAQKRKWYKQQPGDHYQANYRNTHPTYQNSNREKQGLRNRKRAQDASVPKIVKTDASTEKSELKGNWYALIPYSSYTSQKIVKTDVLIVQMVDTAHLKGVNSFKE